MINPRYQLPNLPPPPNRTYSGPDIPTAYDPNWQIYNNLSPAQIAWFQAQPEWQNFRAYVALNPVTAMAATSISTVNAMLQANGVVLATTALPLQIQAKP